MNQDPVLLPDPPLTRAQRAADLATTFCGSWTFVVVFSIITLVWTSLNYFAWGKFDPYPYILLNLVLTVVSTFQGPLIMMSQNRQMERDRDAVQGLHVKLDDLTNKMNLIMDHLALVGKLDG